MKYAVVMGPDTMIYVPSSIKISLGIQKMMRGKQTHLHRLTDSKVIS
jgi:hypothetical protein